MSKTRSANLKFIIAGDPRGAQTAMRTVSVEADGLGGKLKALGGFLTAGAVLAWGRQVVQTYRTVGGEMLKIQRLTGATDQGAAGIWVAAQQSGVSVEKLATSVAIFQSKLQRGDLSKFGIDLTDATGNALPFEEALRRVSDRFASMDDASAKVDLARSLFGRSGADLLPLLNKGGEALDEFIDKAEQMGLVLNSDDVKEATRNQRDFQLATTAAGFVIGKELLPLATKFTTWASAELPRVVGWVTTVGGAVADLPGPVKAVVGAFLLMGPATKVLGMVATPLRVIGNLASSGRAGLDMFRYGLAGITQEGAGAANMAGSFIRTIGPAGVAAGVAGLGLIAVAYTQIQLEQQRTKQNVKDLQQLMEGGLTPTEAAAQKLANTLAGIDGGFAGLRGSSSDFAEQLEALGLSATEATRLISGSREELEAWIKAEANGDSRFERTTVVENLRDMRNEVARGTEAEETRKRVTKELADEYDGLGDSTDENTGSTERNTTAIERATKAMSDLRRKQRDVQEAEQAVAAAHAETQAAQADLATARRAAAGDSDEYRDAVESIRDAEESVADAQAEVVDRQRAVTDAQRDLTQARIDAEERLRSMAQATRDAALAEADAALAAKEARLELERKMRDPRATDLERERAELELRKAEEAARQAAEDNAAQQAANAAAQAAGVNGDAQVIRAREAVAEANRGVIDAERGVAEARKAVGDAERAAAKIIEEARGEVAAAAKRSEDAVIAEADAWGAVAEAQRGPLAGAQAYRDFLANITRDLDPNAPLAQRIARLMTDIDKAILLGRIAKTGSVPADLLNPERRPGSDPAPTAGGDGPRSNDGPKLVVDRSVHLTLQGTPVQQRRAARNAARDVADDDAAETRG